MLQHYHLLIRRPEHGVLADCRAMGWLLPIATADARTRAPLAVAKLLEQLHIAGSVVCVTCGRVDARAARIDWLAVVDDACGTRSGQLHETTIDGLLTGRSVVATQAALLVAYQHLGRQRRSALSPGWFADTRTWLRRACPKIDPQPLVHRADLHEAVWELTAPAASFFLKWRGETPFLDPTIAAIVGAAGPLRVAQTLAHDAGSGRWLTSGVRGRRLTADAEPTTVGGIANAMARTQAALLDAAPQFQSIGVGAESLAELAAEADRWLDRPAANGPDVTAARSRIRRALDELDALRLPATWIHTDFVPENVFVDGADVAVIDFDDPWIGPPPVAMEFLFSGLRRHVGDPVRRSSAIDAAGDRFVEAWRPFVAPDIMRRAFGSTRIVAEVLRVSRRLRALAGKEARGELVGLLEPAARESTRRLVALAQR